MNVLHGANDRQREIEYNRHVVPRQCNSKGVRYSINRYRPLQRSNLAFGSKVTKFLVNGRQMADG